MTNSGQSVTFNYFVGSGKVLSDPTKTTADLAPLQLGVFNAKNYKSLQFPIDSKTYPEVIIAMGSPNEEKINWTNASMSMKSVPIRANKLISWRKSQPTKALQHKVAIGYDGVNDCKTISLDCDEAYTLFLELEGSPASRFFGTKPLSETFVQQTECCSCTGESCTPNVEKFVDNYINQINSDPKISPFIKAEKIVKYTTPPSTEKVNYKSYTLTIADEGGVEDLANVQTTYNNISIERVKRDGIFSTYKVIIPENAASPSAYSIPSNSTLLSCPSGCPSGYTFVPKMDKFKVETSQNTDKSNDLLGINGVLKVELLTLGVDQSSYIVYTESGDMSLAEITNDILNEFAANVTQLETTSAYCKLTSPLSAAWVRTENYYKEVRTLCLTLGDSACGTNGEQLLELLDFYSSNPDIVGESLALDEDGACANSYVVDQLSKDYLPVSSCTLNVANYSELAPFKGHTWGACCEGDETPNEVENIGIILTGAYIDTQFGDCSFKYDDFVELDMVRITVRQGEFVELDDKCAKRWDVTELQKPVYPTGIGRNVLKDYIAIQSTKGQIWSDDPRWREIYGYKYDFIKKDKFYKNYYLEFESMDKFERNLGYGGNDFRQTIVFAFEETVDTTQFENMLESWIQSTRPDLIDSDVKDNLYR